MLARVAWRNLWRNRRRTGIAIAALALGTAALVFTHSFAETFYATMIDLATRGLLGHLQVHGRGYQAEPDVFTVVKDPAAVRTTIDRVLPGAVALERVTAYGLAASGERSAGVAIIGLDPAREAAHTRVLQLARGRTLGPTRAREAVLGDALAKRLHVEPGGELVLLSQAADGSLANDVYTVVGISKGGGTVEAGGAVVFLHLGDAQDFFALGRGVHQVVVTLPDGAKPRQAAATLRAALDPAALEALSWDEMMPEVQAGIEADREGTFLMDVIVFLLVVLGMVNAMTMATYERTFELGVLSALGTRPRGVVATIVLEALFLGVVSLVVGVAVSWALMAVLPPIHLGSMGDLDFIGVAYPEALKLRVAPLALVMAVATVAITSLLGGLVPAWRASRLSPVVAMRSRT